MGENTKIQWCHHSFNPWIGCTKVSEGCAHCYAEAQDKFRKWTPEGWGPGRPRRRTSPLTWKQPLFWNRKAEREGVRRRVFCASLADWLDDEVPAEWLSDLLYMIGKTPNLDWLLLTKRPGLWGKRMELVAHLGDEPGGQFAEQWLEGKIPRNVWVGTTVENQRRAEERVPRLLEIPAAVRFLSVEPMLGPVNLDCNAGGTRWIGGQRGCEGMHHGIGTADCPRELHHHHDERCRPGIDWVICGGESGPGARYMPVDNARALWAQCYRFGVPFFMKQLGGVSKKRGEMEDFPEVLRVREVPGALR